MHYFILIHPHMYLFPYLNFIYLFTFVSCMIIRWTDIRIDGLYSLSVNLITLNLIKNQLFLF